MRALRYDGPWELSVVDLPEPEPGAGEALLRVIATGICGSDIHGYTGRTQRRAPGMIMGHEIAAVVAALGPRSLSGDLEGQPVAVNPFLACGACRQCRGKLPNLCERRRMVGVDSDLPGGYAEWMVAPVGALVPFCGNVPVERAALIEPFAVGYRGAVVGGCEDGHSALVIGGGTIGIAALVAAVRLGAHPVFLSEPTAHRRSIAERLGALVFNSHEHDPQAFVRSKTSELGVDVVLDCVGNSASVADALACCRAQGTVVMVGMEQPAMEIPLYDLVTQERRIVGSFGYAHDDFASTTEWVGSNPPELESIVEGRATFDTVVERFRALATGEDPSVKVLFSPGPR